MRELTAAELDSLKLAAEAAQRQLITGPREWPGKPSAQRLALFLAASPDVILSLIRMVENKKCLP